jgi:hypothetical protein
MSHQSRYNQSRKKRITLTQSQSNSSQDSMPLTNDLPPLKNELPPIPTTDTQRTSTHTRADLPLPDPTATTSGSEKSGTNGKKRAYTKKLPEEKNPIEEATEEAYELSPAHQKKAEQLAAVYAKIGIFIMGVSPDAGKIVFITSMERAQEVLRVARRHKMLMKIVDQIISGNDYVALVLGHVGMVGEILALHGRLPQTSFTTGLLVSGRQHVATWDALANGAAAQGQVLYATP